MSTIIDRVHSDPADSGDDAARASNLHLEIFALDIARTATQKTHVHVYD